MSWYCAVTSPRGDVQPQHSKIAFNIATERDIDAAADKKVDQSGSWYDHLKTPMLGILKARRQSQSHAASIWGNGWTNTLRTLLGSIVACESPTPTESETCPWRVNGCLVELK